MLTVAEVLLNGYVRQWQLPGGAVNSIREQKGWALPSPVMLNTMTVAFRTAVVRFAAERGGVPSPLPDQLLVHGTNRATGTIQVFENLRHRGAYGAE